MRANALSLTDPGPKGRRTRDMETDAKVSDDEWFKAHVMELVEKYPNQWIAISNGSVVCSSATRWGAKSEAKRVVGRGNFSLYFIEPSMLQMGSIRAPSPAEDRQQ